MQMEFLEKMPWRKSRPKNISCNTKICFFILNKKANRTFSFTLQLPLWQRHWISSPRYILSSGKVSWLILNAVKLCSCLSVISWILLAPQKNHIPTICAASSKAAHFEPSHRLILSSSYQCSIPNFALYDPTLLSHYYGETQVKVVMGRGKRGYDQWGGGRMPGKLRHKGT